MSQAERVRSQGKARQEKQSQLKKHQENMVKIKRSPNTVAIKYPEYREAFDFVDNLFPGSGVKDVTMYKVGPTLLARLGYGGAGGFYDRQTKVIIIASYQPKQRFNYPSRYNFNIKANITKDEVIAHELIHYCFVEEGGTSPSREMWEEFAYGWSLEYLRSKGHSDDFIIKYNFFPFLVDIMSNKALTWILGCNDITSKEYNAYSKFKQREFFKKYGLKWHKRRKEMAYKRGEEIIELYTRKAEEGTGCTKEITETSRFDLIDI